MKSLGDDVMVVFPSAAEAAYCAVAMQEAAEKHNAGAEIACLDIRIGIHTGEPIHEDDDYFGTPVVTATRLAGHAQGGQILISDVARRVVGQRARLQFQEHGVLSLKRLAEPVHALEVDWRASPPPPPPRTVSLRATGRANRLLPDAWRHPRGRRGRFAEGVSALFAFTAIIVALMFTVGGNGDGNGLTTGDDTARVLDGLHYRQQLVYPNGTLITGASEESAEGVRVSAVWSTPDELAVIFAFFEGAFTDLGFDTEASTPILESLTIGEGSDAVLVLVEPGRGVNGENLIQARSARIGPSGTRSSPLAPLRSRLAVSSRQ